MTDVPTPIPFPPAPATPNIEVAPGEVIATLSKDRWPAFDCYILVNETGGLVVKADSGEVQWLSK